MPVNTLHPDVATWEPVWDTNIEAYLGDQIIRFGDNHFTYLPKLTTGMTVADYNAYRLRTYFLEATSRSIDGMVGIALWKEPTYSLPEKMEGFITNDQVKAIITELYQTARFGLMIDRGSEDNAPVKNLVYTAKSIINYRLDKQGRFLWVVLKELEDGSSKDDKYVQNTNYIYRELRINKDKNYEVVLHRQNDKGDFVEDKPIIPTKDNEPLKKIPFRIYNTIEASTTIEPPPITGIVRSNIAYYQIYTEVRHKYHWSAIIQPALFGIPKEDAQKLKIGKSVWGISDHRATGMMLETNGYGFEAMMNGLKNELAQMAAQGARLLEPQKKAGEAAETVRLRQTAEVATTSSLVGTVETALRWAIDVGADWEGLTVNSSEAFSMSRDFFTTEMSPERIREITSSWLAGALDDSNLYHNWKDGEVIKTEITEEEFIADLNKKREAMLLTDGIDGRENII